MRRSVSSVLGDRSAATVVTLLSRDAFVVAADGNTARFAVATDGEHAGFPTSGYFQGVATLGSHGTITATVTNGFETRVQDEPP